MRPLILFGALLLAGCATGLPVQQATFENGCEGPGRLACLDRALAYALEYYCRPMAPAEQKACDKAARSAHFDHVMRDAILYEQVRRRNLAPSVPAPVVIIPPAPAPTTTQDPACYAMNENAIYYRLYCR